MRWEWLLILAVAIVGGFILFGRMGRTSSAEAHELVKNGARLIDVRTAAEFARGHLPGATNIPVTDLPKQLSELGDKGDPIVLYCQSGARSGRARRLLQANGFEKVHDLGPMSAW